MRHAARLVVFVAAVASVRLAHAQDLSVVAIEAPGSACMPGSNEGVTIRLFNYGPTLPSGSTFTVSYTLDAGAPTSELVVLGANLLTNSTFRYTFTTTVDVSAPGAHTVDASVSLAGDINPTNNAYTGHAVTTSAASDGGNATGPVVPVLAGSVMLTGYVGDVLEWQQSEDGGLRWRRLANAQATLAFDLLRHDTLFRARVRSGACAPALSSVVAVSSSDPIFYSGFEP